MMWFNLLKSKAGIAGIALIALICVSLYANAQSHRADAAIIERDTLSKSLEEANAAIAEAHAQTKLFAERARKTDELLAKRESDNAATQKALDLSRKKYFDLTLERKNDPNSCVNRAIDSDIAEWMRNATGATDD